jgi:hypothetical protein
MRELISRRAVATLTRLSDLRLSQPSAYSSQMATEPDYYIAVLEADAAFRWRWELRRRSPMGVKIGGSGYQSQTAAEFAGKRVLEDFLVALAKEERRKR